MPNINGLSVEFYSLGIILQDWLFDMNHTPHTYSWTEALTACIQLNKEENQ